jgi:hypothetical protein
MMHVNDAVHHVHVLLDVGIERQFGAAQFAGIDDPLGANDPLADVLRTAVVLAAVTGHVCAVGINEIGRAVVVDVAVFFFARSPCGAARRHYRDRMSALEPVADVDVVQVLLHNLVAADPQEGVPVALLPFQVAPLGVAFLVGKKLGIGEVQHRGAHPVGVHMHDVADLAVADAPVFVEVPGLGAALGARFHGQLEFPGLRRGGHETPYTCGVGTHGLLAENVLSGLYCRLEVHRTIGGIGGQHDDIDVARQQLLVSVEAHEAVLGIHLEAAGKLRLERLGGADGGLQAVLKEVGHGDDLDVFAPSENVLQGLRAAASAADQPGLQLCVALASDQLGPDDLEGGDTADAGRKERPARRGIVHA